MSGVIGPSLAEAVRISFDDSSADWYPPVARAVDVLTPPEATRPGCDGNAPWQVLDDPRIGFLERNGLASSTQESAGTR